MHLLNNASYGIVYARHNIHTSCMTDGITNEEPLLVQNGTGFVQAATLIYTMIHTMGLAGRCKAEWPAY
jgi:hypothetical protein